MPGYIYLIMMADGVYKVGRTFQEYGPRLNRFTAYPGDSELVYVRKCEDANKFETLILRKCRERFGCHRRGSEYFEGPENEFISIIDEVFNPKKVETPVVIPPLEVDPKTRFLCEKLEQLETESYITTSTQLYDEYELWHGGKEKDTRVSFGIWLKKLGPCVHTRRGNSNTQIVTFNRLSALKTLPSN